MCTKLSKDLGAYDDVWRTFATQEGFFSLKGTNIYWRGYIYLWLCTYTLMNVLSIGNIFYMCTSIIVCSLSWYFIMKGYITIFTFFFSLCLFLNLFVFIPVSYFLAYSLRACCSRYCIFRLFTWGRWRSANYWLILLHAGFPFFYFFSRFHLRAISFRLLSHSFSVFFICLILTFLFFHFFCPVRIDLLLYLVPISYVYVLLSFA